LDGLLFIGIGNISLYGKVTFEITDAQFKRSSLPTS